MINGIYAATLSLLNDDLGLDINKTISHAEKIIDNGCHGVVFFGSTGQSQLISLTDKINLINTELIVSKSENENKNFWKIREEIPLAEKQLKNIIQHDVSLPLKNIENFIDVSTNYLKKLDSNIKIINFGHLGDNNLHFNVFIDRDVNNEEYNFLKKKINEIIFSNVSSYEGAISAEHGIGQLRRKQLKKYKSPDDLRIMNLIKKIYDPNNIMNPGKVF